LLSQISTLNKHKTAERRIYDAVWRTREARQEGASIDPIALRRKNSPDRYRNIAATTGAQRVAPAMFIE